MQAVKGWLIVRFGETPLAADEDVLSVAELARQLEQDFVSLQEHLGAVTGESDSSSEALRASTEALRAANEEL